jgi:hypothetical protein
MNARLTSTALVLALLAVMLVAYVASAALVEPKVVGGNPKLCDCGIRIDPPPASGESTTVAFEISCSGTTYTGTVTVTVYDTPYGQEFDFVSSIPVGKVVAKGGKQGANVYDYTALPSPVYSDTGLHAPVNPSGKWANLSHISFCFAPGENGGGQTYTQVTVMKFYDRDMDGMKDAGEPGLDGWMINIDGDMVGSFMTADGGYVYLNLYDGSYTISEALPPGGSCWKQTWPEDNAYSFVIPDTAPEGDLLFGNVCEVTLTCGKTIGFWSNKNGKAILDAKSGWTALLAGYNLVNEDGSWFDPTDYSGFKSWLLKARSVNMSYMLSAQMAATILNLAYMCPDGTGDAYGVVIDDEWKSLNDIIEEANDFLAAHPNTSAYDEHRAHAEMYKCIFDDFNNNRLKLIPYDPCQVPVWP